MEPLKGYEGFYLIDREGNIFGVKRKKYMKSRLNRKGYTIICLSKMSLTIRGQHRQKTHTVHRLVANQFIPNPENKGTINHKNGIKTDNRVENLEWATQKENNIHAFKNGLKQSGSEHYTAVPVLDVRTGIFYGNLKEAARAKVIKYTTLVQAVRKGYSEKYGFQPLT